ncbi:unnamed protein product [Arctogadus glacialis]
MATTDIKYPEIHNAPGEHRYHNNSQMKNIVHSPKREMGGKRKTLTKADIGTPRNFHVAPSSNSCPQKHLTQNLAEECHPMPSFTAHHRPRISYELETVTLPPYGLSCMLHISRNCQQHCETLPWSLTSLMSSIGAAEKATSSSAALLTTCQSAQRVHPALDCSRPCDGETQQTLKSPSSSKDDSAGSLDMLAGIPTWALKSVELNPMDPELKHLFNMCGISEAQLKDEETSKIKDEFIEEKGGVEAVKNELRRQGPPRWNGWPPSTPAIPPRFGPSPSTPLPRRLPSRCPIPGAKLSSASPAPLARHGRTMKSRH